MFLTLSSGIQTKNDGVTIQFSPLDRDRLIDEFTRLQSTELAQQYPSKKVWSVANAKADIESGDYDRIPILYRPFDVRHTVLTRKSGGFIGRPRFDVMRHFVAANLGLVVNKKFVGDEFSHAGVSPTPICHGTFYLGNRGQDFLCPLYLYPDDTSKQGDAFTSKHRVPNLDPKLYTAICEAGGIDPTDQAGPDDDFRAATGDARPSEVKVFDYIYGVLHAPVYRETFAEFLKIDFPRIPYPPSPEVFRHVSEKGEALRRLHLMEPAAVGETPYPYHGEGDDVVASGFPKWERSGTPDQLRGDEEGQVGARPESNTVTPAPEPGSRSPSGRVHVNKDQYFDGVPELAWSFYIGGYQPAQKWLKDRRGRALSWDDVTHYQKIVKILAETGRIMRQIALPIAPDS